MGPQGWGGQGIVGVHGLEPQREHGALEHGGGVQGCGLQGIGGQVGGVHGLELHAAKETRHFDIRRIGVHGLEEQTG